MFDRLRRNPRRKTILFFGLASLLTDISSEMILPVLPLFMSTELGLGKVFIGMSEGLAESASSLAKLFSGRLSDLLPRRKPLILLGYGISSLTKPFLSLAQAGSHVVGLRFADRLGKGIRTSPRDALLAESVPAEDRGLAFGFHRSMDSAGAIIGPGLAALLLMAGAGHRSIFLWAFLPALAAVLVLGLVREAPRAPRPPASAAKGSWRELAADRRFLLFLGACALFTLGNSSDAFIILRARDAGVGLALIPLLAMSQNVVNTLVAAPAGWLSDRIGRRRILQAGLALYALVYAGLAVAGSAWQIWALVGLYGVYYGLAEGGFRAFVADLVPPERLGTAYGLYHTVTGLTLLPASLLAGLLWETVGHRAAFFTGGALALLAALLLLLVRIPDRRP
jgi:MFS family permease